MNPPCFLAGEFNPPRFSAEGRIRPMAKWRIPQYLKCLTDIKVKPHLFLLVRHIIQWITGVHLDRAYRRLDPHTKPDARLHISDAKIIHLVVHIAHIKKDSTLNEIRINGEGFFRVRDPECLSADGLLVARIPRPDTPLTVTANGVGAAREVALIDRHFYGIAEFIHETDAALELQNHHVKILEISAP